MTIPAITFELIPYATPSQRWGDIDADHVIPNPSFGPIPFATPSQRWGDTSEMVIPHPTEGGIPFIQQAQRWGDSVEVVTQPMTDCFDPDSTPYIEESGLFPRPSAVNVPSNSAIVIPCADKVTPSEDEHSVSVGLFDTITPPTTELVGLNPIKTVIKFSINGGSQVVAFSGGAARNGWSLVSAVANNYSGRERDIFAGITYTLLPPGGQFTPGSSVIYTVYLEDYGGNYNTLEYSFYVANYSSIKISGFLLVAEDVLMITFSAMVVNNTELNDVRNFSIFDLSGGSNPSVLKTLPTYSVKTDKVYFKISELTLGHSYRFVVTEGMISDENGLRLREQRVRWDMRRTKIDSTISSLARFYATKTRGEIRGVIEAIMLSDELIGGDF